MWKVCDVKEMNEVTWGRRVNGEAGGKAAPAWSLTMPTVKGGNAKKRPKGSEGNQECGHWRLRGSSGQPMHQVSKLCGATSQASPFSPQLPGHSFRVLCALLLEEAHMAASIHGSVSCL